MNKYDTIFGALLYLNDMDYDFENNSAKDLLEAVGELIFEAAEDEELSYELLRRVKAMKKFRDDMIKQTLSDLETDLWNGVIH